MTKHKSWLASLNTYFGLSHKETAMFTIYGRWLLNAMNQSKSNSDTLTESYELSKTLVMPNRNEYT